MKKFKLLISTLFGVILATIGLTTFSAYADNTPTVSTTLDYVIIDNEELVKATIYFSDFASVSDGRFHVELGDGFVFDNDGDTNYINYNCDEMTSSLVGNAHFVGNAGSHSAFVYFASPSLSNQNINGAFVEVFLKETSSATQANSTFNFVFGISGIGYDQITNNTSSITYNATNTNIPYMYKSARYVLGDVDGNGVVNSSDATAIDTVLSQYPYSYNISDIEGTYYYLFPYADDAWALDANQNGTLTNSDSTAISQYIAQGSSYSGNIGKIFYHCYYV